RVLCPCFRGANTSFRPRNQDEEQLKVVQDFLRDGQVTIDIFGMARTGRPPAHTEKRASGQDEPRLASTFAVGEESADFGGGQAFIAPPVEVIAPLDKVDAAVRRGESERGRG